MKADVEGWVVYLLRIKMYNPLKLSRVQVRTDVMEEVGESRENWGAGGDSISLCP